MPCLAKAFYILLSVGKDTLPPEHCTTCTVQFQIIDIFWQGQALLPPTSIIPTSWSISNNSWYFSAIPLLYLYNDQVLSPQHVWRPPFEGRFLLIWHTQYVLSGLSPSAPSLMFEIVFPVLCVPICIVHCHLITLLIDNLLDDLSLLSIIITLNTDILAITLHSNNILDHHQIHSHTHGYPKGIHIFLPITLPSLPFNLLDHLCHCWLSV